MSTRIEENGESPLLHRSPIRNPVMGALTIAFLVVAAMAHMRGFPSKDREGSKLAGFKDFRLGMTRAEIWKIAQEEELNVASDGFVHVSDSQIRGAFLIFEDGGTLGNAPDQRSRNSRLITLIIHNMDQDPHIRPKINGFKEFRLGMTYAEAWKVVQTWDVKLDQGALHHPVYPSDRPDYRGIKVFEFDFDDNKRLVKMVIHFTDGLDLQTEEGGKFFDALGKKYGLPKTVTVSLIRLFGEVQGHWVWENIEDDLHLTATMAPSRYGGVSLNFERGVISRERAEKEALRQRTSDAIEALKAD